MCKIILPRFRLWVEVVISIWVAPGVVLDHIVASTQSAHTQLALPRFTPYVVLKESLQECNCLH